MIVALAVGGGRGMLIYWGQSLAVRRGEGYADRVW